MLIKKIGNIIPAHEKDYCPFKLVEIKGTKCCFKVSEKGLFMSCNDFKGVDYEYHNYEEGDIITIDFTLHLILLSTLKVDIEYYIVGQKK